jgi:hypothetical protein
MPDRQSGRYTVGYKEAEKDYCRDEKKAADFIFIQGT